MGESFPVKSESTLSVQTRVIRILSGFSRSLLVLCSTLLILVNVLYGVYVSKQWRTGTHHWSLCIISYLYSILPLIFWINCIILCNHYKPYIPHPMSAITQAIQPPRLCRTCLIRQSVQPSTSLRLLHTSRPNRKQFNQYQSRSPPG